MIRDEFECDTDREIDTVELGRSVPAFFVAITDESDFDGEYEFPE